ncbi:MAG: winged helix-turn-helix transcriptional regulator, partial [Candidatus Hodarchaeota archaeon]
MSVLRKKSDATKMLILRELVCTPNIKMKDIAQHIGITIQAVSEYLIKMRDEGLVVSVGKGEYIASNEGVQFLHASLIDLQEFVDQVSSDLTIVRRCTALAETTI